MKPFKDIRGYGNGDIIQALLLLEEPYPTEKDLDKVRDRVCFPTLYTAIDALTGGEWGYE
jgi:hypothetical protein